MKSIQQPILMALVLAIKAINCGLVGTDQMEVMVKNEDSYWPQATEDCRNETLLALMDFSNWGKAAFYGL